jgi:hypothetical protein
VDAPLIDALGVSTLVLQNDSVPGNDEREPRPGWHIEERSTERTVWVRDEPLGYAGRVTWTTPGMDVTGDVSAAQRETVEYSADEDGRIAMARLAWPGYTATVDGQEISVENGPAGLVVLDVPAGDHTVVLDYEPPGQVIGMAAAGAAAVLVALQSVFWWWQRRRSRL